MFRHVLVESTPFEDYDVSQLRLDNVVPLKLPFYVQYEAGSAPYLALEATIERTNNRFANYGKANLLCGTDGLPHLIADPGLALKYGHAGEIFVSSFISGCDIPTVDC